jgi:hypothetical protein
MKNTTILTFVIVASAISASADIGLVAGANGVKADVGVASVNQPAPGLKLGPTANSNALFDISLKNGIAVTLPFVSLNIPLFSAKVGTKDLGVAVGQDNKVNIGEASVSQSLPSAQVGTQANKSSLFDIRLKDGIGVTLPFVSVDVPYPKVLLKEPVTKK